MDGDSQDWRGMSGAVAWQLIDRHAEGWEQVGEMMRVSAGRSATYAT